MHDSSRAVNDRLPTQGQDVREVRLQRLDDLGRPSPRVDARAPRLDLAVAVDHHADARRALRVVALARDRRRRPRTGSAGWGDPRDRGDLGEQVALEPAWKRANPLAPTLEDQAGAECLPKGQVPAPPPDQGSPIGAKTELFREARVGQAERHLAAPKQEIVATGSAAHVGELDADDEGLLREGFPPHPPVDIPDERARVQLIQASTRWKATGSP